MNDVAENMVLELPGVLDERPALDSTQRTMSVGDEVLVLPEKIQALPWKGVVVATTIEQSPGDKFVSVQPRGRNQSATPVLIRARICTVTKPSGAN